jgi:hypothetical protein
MATADDPRAQRSRQFGPRLTFQSFLPSGRRHGGLSFFAGTLEIDSRNHQLLVVFT